MGGRMMLADTVDALLVSESHASEASQPLAHPVVLVVEDDDDTREIIASLLSHRGVCVLEAATASAALQLAWNRDVRAVVLDVVLPDSTGFEVCQKLRENPKTHRLPVVMMTALTDLTHEVTGILAGADAYLVKPIRGDQLIRQLRDLI